MAGQIREFTDEDAEKNSLIDRISGEVLGDEISFAFFVVLITIFLIAILSHFVQHRSAVAANITRIAPSALTSIGVLGTFFGIFLGLLEFDVSDIDASVPPLLDGLKVAFITSIMGISLAVVFRIFESVLPTNAGPGGVSADEIFAVLSDIRNEARQFHDESKDAAEKVSNAIGGEGESSVVTQIQNLRMSVADGNDSLLQEFREFAENMAENNSKALIVALSEVMRDFNAKINEQFGDNFQQLNEAVGALLVWQENYKSHVESMTEQFEKTLRGIEAARASLSEIATHADSIPKAMTTLHRVVEAMHQQTQEMERHLEAFQNLRSQAGEAFPVIEQNLTSLTEGVSRDIQRVTTQLQQEFEKTISESNDVLAKQITELDQSMQDQLRRSIELMGGHLAALSNKFVEDYGPLTDRLRQVVTIAERL